MRRLTETQPARCAVGTPIGDAYAGAGAGAGAGPATGESVDVATGTGADTHAGVGSARRATSHLAATARPFLRTRIAPAELPLRAADRRFCARIGRLAVRSLYAELSLYPKPGLVSLKDNGSHEDMTAATFVRSMFALRHYFIDITRAGMRGAPFSALTALGVEAERRMLGATAGINTHRGAIFALGLLCAAIGACRATGAPRGGTAGISAGTRCSASGGMTAGTYRIASAGMSAGTSGDAFCDLSRGTPGGATGRGTARGTGRGTSRDAPLAPDPASALDTASAAPFAPPLSPDMIRAVLVARWGAALAAHARPAAAESHGTRASARHGVGGARQEAALGMPAVFDLALPALDRARCAGRGPRLARVDALFALMAHISDTNVYHRGGATGAALVRRQARAFLAAGGTGAPDWRARAEACHRAFVQRRLSPGGAADLLAAACLVDMVTRDSRASAADAGWLRDEGHNAYPVNA